MGREIATAVIIDASAERVWDALTDFDRYAEWNPFLIAIRGSATAGSHLQVTARLPGIGRLRFRPVVLKADGLELSWRGGLPLAGWFDGVHRFILEPLAGGRVRLLHGEVLSGRLVSLLWPVMGKKMKSGFSVMNAALKVRAEGANRRL